MNEQRDSPAPRTDPGSTDRSSTDPGSTAPGPTGEGTTPPHGDPLFSAATDDGQVPRRKEQDGTAQGKQDDFGLDFVEGTPKA